jgi:hypothetical protein
VPFPNKTAFDVRVLAPVPAPIPLDVRINPDVEGVMPVNADVPLVPIAAPISGVTSVGETDNTTEPVVGLSGSPIIISPSGSTLKIGFGNPGRC